MKPTLKTEGTPSALVFEKQLNLMKASEFCERFGYSLKTIYEWKYRPKRNNVPADLVVKFRGRLFVRTDILNELIPRNPVV
jgi:hypothetical protein